MNCIRGLDKMGSSMVARQILSVGEVRWGKGPSIVIALEYNSLLAQGTHCVPIAPHRASLAPVPLGPLVRYVTLGPDPASDAQREVSRATAFQAFQG